MAKPARIDDDDDDTDGQEAAAAGDEILRCTVVGGAARIVAVTATGVAREAIRRHAATGAAAVALARGVTSGLLLATLTKDEERVTMQLLGDGPLGGLTVDATASGTARAYVKIADVGPALPVERPRLGSALGTGVVNVIRDVGLREVYRGQTPFASGEVDDDCERYLTTSEQIESALRCETVLAADGTLRAAAGILVQALPGGNGAAVVAAARARFATGALRDALAAAAAAPPDAGSPPDATTLPDAGTLIEEALGDVLGAWHALDVRPVRFHCPCSRARASASLALLGATELATMILEDGKADVVCNFCRQHHGFTAADLERLRRELQGSADPPS